MLSALTPKQQDQQFGMHLYKNIQILRFLGNTNAIGVYEAVLQFDIIERGNVTREEVEAFYRRKIGRFVSEIVDENIAKSRFGAPTAEALADIKNIITQFLLNPTPDNFLVIDRRLSYYYNTDGNRGMAAYQITMDSIISFNVALADALISGRLPASAGRN
jgi:hypothetical protein